MRRLLIHLAVALAAFVVGVKLAWAFGAVFGSAVKPEDVRPVSVAPVVMSAPSCKTAPRIVIEAPAPPAPPARPAAPKSTKQTRVVIRRPDGTVHVVETQTEPAAKGKF
jgi:hypothetical protein